MRGYLGRENVFEEGAGLAHVWQPHCRKAPAAPPLTIFVPVAIVLGILSGSLHAAKAADCPGGIEDLRMQLQWVSQPQFAGFQIPNSRDSRLPSYAEECLRVKVQPGGADWDPLEELSSGRVDIATVNGLEAVKQYMTGMNLTIIYHNFRRNPYIMVSFMRTKDLEGAKVAVWCCGHAYSSKSMVSLEGANVEYVDQGWTLNPLYDGQVDVASAMTYNELGRILQQVNPDTEFLYQYDELQIWNPDDYPVPEVHMALVVDSRRLAELRPRLIRFLKVVNRAWNACRDQEEVCVSHYPSSDQAHMIYMMREINRLNYPSPQGLGVLPQEEYDRMMTFAEQLGLVSSPPPFDEVVDMSLMQEVEQDPSVEEPYDKPVVRFCAPYGSGDYRVCQGFEHTLCPAGSQPYGPGDGNCTLCPPGKFSFEPKSPLSARMLRCQDCPAGKFEFGSGATDCDLCATGTFSAQGQVKCTACPSGRSTDLSRGAPVCSVCAPGRFAGKNGSAECTMCSKGEYQEEAEAEACKPCGTSMTTELLGASKLEQCICMAGSRSLPGGGCGPCGAGMLCEEGAPEVLIEEGYFSEPDLEVFRCFGNAKRCSGGRPGETCAAGRTGIACAECLDGWAAQANGECKPCAGGNYVPVVLVALVGLVLLTLVYYVIDKQDYSKQGQATLLFAMTLSLLISLMQQLSIVSLFALEWPEPLRSCMRVMSVFMLDMETLEIACITGTGSAVGNFLAKLLVMVIWFALLVVIHCAFVVIFYQGKFKERMASLICGVGTCFLVVYISIVSTVIGPLRCLMNPNGRQTVHEYQSVICWEGGEHASMVALGLIAVLAPLSFLAWSGAVIWQLPASMRRGDAVYLRKYAFLFARFRPDVFWYSLVHIARSLAFSLTSIIPSIVAQIVVTQLILCVSSVLSSLLFPWRVRFANVLDIAMTIAITMLVSTSAFFVEGESLESIAWIGSVILVALIASAFPVLGFSIYQRWAMAAHKPFSHFICHHKAGAGSFARLLKMCLLESSKVKKRVFIDSDDLTDLEMIFDYVGSQSDRLIILCSKDIFSRPWCMGEMVFAMSNAVPAVRVVFPDFNPPGPEFIEAYDQYVPDVACLASRGLGVSDVQKALVWTLDLPAVSLPDRLATSVTKQLVSELTEGVLRSSAIPSAKAEGKLDTKVAIVVDHTCMEAGATAMILSQMLRPRMSSRPDEIPAVLPNGEELPGEVAKVIFILSSGVFGRVHFLQALLAATTNRTKYLLVISDDSFRFPTAQTLLESKAVADAVTDNAEGLFEAAKELFSTIAIVFQPELYSSTATVLATKADEIHDRLVETNSRLKSICYDVGVHDV